ncbi:Fibrinogen-like protein 1-like protein [Pitangus sulphuratus]|nr:Fibrinogen-like protein 1-like protein [Pitangus sulphuratus]
MGPVFLLPAVIPEVAAQQQSASSVELCQNKTSGQKPAEEKKVEGPHLYSLKFDKVMELLAPPASGFPPDCSHLRKNSPSGVYVIQPARSPPRVVWCDMDTEGKGWTVVQRNSHDTELNWKQSWTTYKYGFGNVHADYWLGTEYLHLLTQQGTYKVRFVVRDKTNVTHFAEYDIFRVESEASGYPLRLGRHSGDGDDYLTLYHPKKGGIHDNMKFSTVDKDQDQYSGNCAKSYGGWWYNRCQNVLLNAKNYIVWPGFCDSGDCASSLILVKPTDVC